MSYLSFPQKAVSVAAITIVVSLALATWRYSIADTCHVACYLDKTCFKFAGSSKKQFISSCIHDLNGPAQGGDTNKEDNGVTDNQWRTATQDAQCSNLVEGPVTGTGTNCSSNNEWETKNDYCGSECKAKSQQ